MHLKKQQKLKISEMIIYFLFYGLFYFIFLNAANLRDNFYVHFTINEYGSSVVSLRIFNE